MPWLDATRMVPALLVTIGSMLATTRIFAEDGTAKPSPVSPPAAPDAQQEITNTIGMKLRLIRSGNYLMGSPDSDKEAFPKEKPQHRVWISKPFHLGKYEVTRREFGKFVAATGYKTIAEQDGIGGAGFTGNRLSPFASGPGFTWKNDGRTNSESVPVINVSWHDADQFCLWLSKVEGKTYRLPTEAEWEWACRGGATVERWSCGDDPAELQTHANILDASARAEAAIVDGEVGWNDGAPFVAEVGKYKPNPFGLHDMHGNVLEWCNDWFDETYYARSPIKNPRGPATGSTKVLRGGCWWLRPLDCRSACRGGADPHAARHFNVGFRVACFPTEPKAEGERPAK